MSTHVKAQKSGNSTYTASSIKIACRLPLVNPVTIQAFPFFTTTSAIPLSASHCATDKSLLTNQKPKAQSKVLFISSSNDNLATGSNHTHVPSIKTNDRIEINGGSYNLLTENVAEYRPRLHSHKNHRQRARSLHFHHYHNRRQLASSLVKMR